MKTGVGSKLHSTHIFYKKFVLFRKFLKLFENLIVIVTTHFSARMRASISLEKKLNVIEDAERTSTADNGQLVRLYNNHQLEKKHGIKELQ